MLNLDVTLVYGKRDLEATKIVVSVFLYGSFSFRATRWRTQYVREVDAAVLLIRQMLMHQFLLLIHQ